MNKQRHQTLPPRRFRFWVSISFYSLCAFSGSLTSWFSGTRTQNRGTVALGAVCQLGEATPWPGTRTVACSRASQGFDVLSRASQGFDFLSRAKDLSKNKWDALTAGIFSWFFSECTHAITKKRYSRQTNTQKVWYAVDCLRALLFSVLVASETSSTVLQDDWSFPLASVWEESISIGTSSTLLLSFVGVMVKEKSCFASALDGWLPAGLPLLGGWSRRSTWKTEMATHGKLVLKQLMLSKILLD